MRLKELIILVTLPVFAASEALLNAASSPSGTTQLLSREISHLNHQFGNAKGNSCKIDGGPLTGYDPDKDIDDETLQRYFVKGKALMCAMRHSDRFAGMWLSDKRNPPSAASVWDGDLKTDLALWGWHDTEAFEDNQCAYDKHWRLKNAFAGLGLNSQPAVKGGHNRCYAVEHWDSTEDDRGEPTPPERQTYTVNGKVYRVTAAHFSFAINTVGGAIFAQSLDNPMNQAEQLWGRKPSKDELPALRIFSDILWGYWNRDNPDIKNIRYYGVNTIINDDTCRLIALALRVEKRTLEPWPGTTFDMGSTAGQYILASPVGAAIAYFLIQHKAQLGPKAVTKVVVLKDDSDDPNPDPHLIFTIEDAPPPDPNNVPSSSLGLGREEVRAAAPTAVRAVRSVHSVSEDGKNMVRIHRVEYLINKMVVSEP